MYWILELAKLYLVMVMLGGLCVLIGCAPYFIFKLRKEVSTYAVRSARFKNKRVKLKGFLVVTDNGFHLLNNEVLLVPSKRTNWIAGARPGNFVTVDGKVDKSGYIVKIRYIVGPYSDKEFIESWLDPANIAILSGVVLNGIAHLIN